MRVPKDETCAYCSGHRKVVPKFETCSCLDSGLCMFGEGGLDHSAYRFFRERGKSGLQRAGCWLTTRRGNPTESATENTQPKSRKGTAMVKT